MSGMESSGEGLPAPGVRLAHFSDIHLFRPGPWTARELFGKRVTGSFNYRFLGRGARFKDADKVVAALRRDLEATPTDCLVFTGDAASFGVDTELEAAAAALPLQLHGVAVPGNHDYYTPTATKRGSFERCFADWQEGERVDEHIYPFARRVGGIWIVCLNSSTHNFLFWDARGRVGTEQLERFDALCAKLEGPKILATHYPYRLGNGQPEHPGRQLRDAEALAVLVAKHKFTAWLHGHRHRNYWLPADADRSFACLCAGSATQLCERMYNVYTITSDAIGMERRTYSPESEAFLPIETIAIPHAIGNAVV